MNISNIVKKIKHLNKNTVLVAIALVGVVVTGVLIFADQGQGFTMPSLFGTSPQKVAEKAVNYINTAGLSSTPVSLVSAEEASGLIKIKIKIGANEFDSYATKDGKLLFPQAFDMSKTTDNSDTADNGDNQDTVPTEVTKNDSPMLEAYVVSRCPYGLQMQRAMADAVKNLPALAPYMKVRYMGEVSGDTITAMHGEAEAKENLRQICIREEQANKYWDYVACQMKAGDTAGCEKSTGIDSAKLNACTSTPSRGVAYAKQDFDLNTKYNVTGSPTLVLNEAVISESSYGGRSSDGVKKMICAGFNTEASFCSTALNTATAASSFSADYAGSQGTNSAAECN